MLTSQSMSRNKQYSKDIIYHFIYIYVTAIKTVVSGSVQIVEKCLRQAFFGTNVYRDNLRSND